MSLGAVWIAAGIIIIGLTVYVLGLSRKVSKRRASRAQHNTTSVRLYDAYYSLLWAGSDFPSVAVVEHHGQRSVWKLDWEYVPPNTGPASTETEEPPSG